MVIGSCFTLLLRCVVLEQKDDRIPKITQKNLYTKVDNFNYERRSWRLTILKITCIACFIHLTPHTSHTSHTSDTGSTTAGRYPGARAKSVSSLKNVWLTFATPDLGITSKSGSPPTALTLSDCSSLIYTAERSYL